MGEIRNKIEEAPVPIGQPFVDGSRWNMATNAWLNEWPRFYGSPTMEHVWKLQVIEKYKFLLCIVLHRDFPLNAPHFHC